jgi:uncharacterized protein YjaZ
MRGNITAFQQYMYINIDLHREQQFLQALLEHEYSHHQHCQKVKI